MKRPGNSNIAFSLIEVNLAVFLVAAGLLVLFSLYPLGLRESEMALTDTQEAMFADFVLGAMKGNALSKTNWSQWTSGDFVDGGSIGGYSIVQAGSRAEEPKFVTEFPYGSGYPLQYHLLVETYPSGSDGSRKRVILSVKGGKYGKMNIETKCYVTDLVYMGM